MVIEFYYMAPSPPSRSVWMVLKVLDLEFVPKHINLMKGEHKQPEYLAINPRGKIPSLKDDDYVIAESRAIATYLCNQYKKENDSNRLYPVDPKARGVVDQILYVSEYVDEVVKSYVNTRGVIFRGEKPCEDKLDDVYKALKLYETFLDSCNEFIAGNHLTLADFFMLAPLQSLEIPGNVDFSDYSRTITWLKKMKNLPYYDECNSEGLKIFETSYLNALAKTKAT